MILAPHIHRAPHGGTATLPWQMRVLLRQGQRPSGTCFTNTHLTAP